MKRPGRPALPDEKRKDKRAYVMLTKEELTQIDEMAEANNQSRMGFLRSILDSEMSWEKDV